MGEPSVNPRLSAALDKATKVAEVFVEAGYHFYFVGGVVRDSLIGIDREENDLDVTTEARPETIKQLVSPLAEAVWSQGERFGTIGCVIDGHMFEITTHRAERYEPGSRKPVVAFGDHLDEDLSRRDFTINAMAVDVLERRIIDIFDGEADLRNHVLRTPLDPEISFSDDPLRMLRAARFRAGYELEPAPGLVDAIRSTADRLSIVSAERIRDELQKLLLLPEPAAGLEMLRSTGLMGRIVAELGRLDASELMAVSTRIAAVAPKAAHRWAALLPDREALRGRLRSLKASGSLMSHADLILRAASFIEQVESGSEPDVRRLAAMCGRGGIAAEEVIDWKRRCMSAAGEVTGGVDAIDSTLARLRLTEHDLDSPVIGLDGHEICRELGIDPGVDVGRAVEWLREVRFTDGMVPRPELIERLRAWWKTV